MEPVVRTRAHLLPHGNTGQVPDDSGPEPAEPPPGYEEVQSQSVAHELEESLRRAS